MDLYMISYYKPELQLYKELGLRWENISYYNQKIKTGEFFAFPKILHGFWEKLVGIELDQVPEGRQKYLYPQEPGQEYNSDHRSRCRVYHPCIDNYYGELFKMIKGPQPEGLFLGVSHLGFSGDVALIREPNDMLAVMKKLLEGNNALHYGLVWKDACYSGRILDFIKTIRERRVVVVGMEHLRGLQAAWDIPDFHHHLVSPPVMEKLDSTILKLLRLNMSMRDKPTVYLFQLGGSASAFVIYSLKRHFKNGWMIDLGRAMDLWLPEGQNQAWVLKMEKKAMNRLLHPK